uniref:Uncharacterized protein n=1 Tax=Heterorhabditis bacteriophora TaxID=37862 RepID=A0A1I7W9Q5_HETBA
MNEVTNGKKNETICMNHVNERVQLITAIMCILFCFLSLIIMFLTSYLDSRVVTQMNHYCGVSGSVTEGFALFHQNFNLVCQVGKSAGKREYGVPPLSVGNQDFTDRSIYLLKNFTDVDISKEVQNLVVTYSPAIFQISKFALYIFTGKEFRQCLLRLINERSVTERPDQTKNKKKMISTINANSCVQQKYLASN